MNLKKAFEIIKKESSIEEIKRHTSFVEIFLPLYLFLGILIFWFVKIYSIFILLSSLIFFTLSAFMPDILFIILIILEVDEPLYDLRKKTHSFSYSLLYFLFLSFLTAPIFKKYSFIVSTSSILGYWLHLFVDKLEWIIEIGEKYLNRLLKRKRY